MKILGAWWYETYIWTLESMLSWSGCEALLSSEPSGTGFWIEGPDGNLGMFSQFSQASCVRFQS